jgi:uncharacterized membrane protein
MKMQRAGRDNAMQLIRRIFDELDARGPGSAAAAKAAIDAANARAKMAKKGRDNAKSYVRDFDDELDVRDSQGAQNAINGMKVKLAIARNGPVKTVRLIGRLLEDDLDARGNVMSKPSKAAADVKAANAAKAAINAQNTKLKMERKGRDNALQLIRRFVDELDELDARGPGSAAAAKAAIDAANARAKMQRKGRDNAMGLI